MSTPRGSNKSKFLPNTRGPYHCTKPGHKHKFMFSIDDYGTMIATESFCIQLEMDMYSTISHKKWQMIFGGYMLFFKIFRSTQEKNINHFGFAIRGLFQLACLHCVLTLILTK